MQIVLYPLTIIFMLPFSYFGVFYPLYAIQWEVGAFAIFLSWLNMLLMFQRLYIFGIYVVMFVQILRTISKVLVLFFILFIGFGLVFYVCLNYPVNSVSLFV